MKFHYTSLGDCHTAKVVVIVTDVLRAFSTAAYAFSRGAREMLLVSTVTPCLSNVKRVISSCAMSNPDPMVRDT